MIMHRMRCGLESCRISYTLHSIRHTHCKGPDITARPLKQPKCLPKSDRQATYCVLCGVQFTFKSKLHLTYWRMYAAREVLSDSFHSPDKLHGRTTAKCNICPTGENASGFNFDAACRNCANTSSAQVEYKPSWETNNRSAGQQITRLLWKTIVHYCDRTSAMLEPTANHLNPFSTLHPISLRLIYILLNIRLSFPGDIVPSHLQTTDYVSQMEHACYIHGQSIVTWSS